MTHPVAEKSVARLATVSIWGTAYFLAVIIAMHVLSPDFNPVDRPTSEYAKGPFGYLMTSAFVSLSVSTWALVMGLRRNLLTSAQSRLGLGFLGVFGIGLLVAAAFPIDLKGAPQTLAGAIHSINGPIAFLSLTLGTNLVSRGLKRDPKWHPISRVASVIAILMVPEFVAGGLSAARGTGAGLAQRILLATFVTWYLLMAVRLRTNTAKRPDLLSAQ